MTAGMPPYHLSSFQQSSVLTGRIAAKKEELANLQQLRDVSGSLASQIQVLEEKLVTLKDGTEGLWCTSLYAYGCRLIETAVACVMANWGSVLSAIKMASSKAFPIPTTDSLQILTVSAQAVQSQQSREDDALLPATLVRIPSEISHLSRETNTLWIWAREIWTVLHSRHTAPFAL